MHPPLGRCSRRIIRHKITSMSTPKARAPIYPDEEVHPVSATIYPDGDAVLVVVHNVFNDSTLTTCLAALEGVGIRPREKNPGKMFHVGFDPGVTLQQAMTVVKYVLRQGGVHVTVGR